MTREVIVPHCIKKWELDGVISEEAKKLFLKVKAKPELAVTISAKSLPAATKLYKIYATTAEGARRLLFFCRQTTPDKTGASLEKWVLLFYRTKGDLIGDNMSHKNPAFAKALDKRLAAAIDDFVQKHVVEAIVGRLLKIPATRPVSWADQILTETPVLTGR